jgi:predicted transcriptional regulator
MSAKETALRVINELSDDVTWGQLTEELYAAAVREGLDQLDRGEGIRHEEVKQQFDSWFSK